MHHIINGTRYHVVSGGEGDPLVLLHGFTGDASTWEPFFHTWKKHSTLYSIDIIGHGKTDSPQAADRYKMISAAWDLCLLFDRLGVRKADLLGYSMGGRLALTFAVLYPERVRKLILESSSPGLKTEEERIRRQEKDRELALLIKERGIREFVEYWEEIPLFETQKNLPKRVRQKIRKQRLKNSETGLANSLEGMGTGAQPSWWGHLEKLNLPVLLLTGTLDLKFHKIAAEMAKKLPDCRWVKVNNCGHAIHVEESKKFGTIVSEFLSNT